MTEFVSECESEPEFEQAPRRRVMAIVRAMIGLGVGAIAVWVAIRSAGGFADAWVAVRKLDLVWLVPAFAVEAASYVVLGAKLRRLIGPQVVSGLEATELGLVVSGFGLLTPASPAEGLAIAAGHLRRRGLPRRQVTMIFGFSEWFSTRVFLGLAAVNLLAIAVIEKDPLIDLWPFVAVAVAILVLLGASARLAARPGTAERLSQMAGAFRRPSRRLSVEARRAAGAEWYREARAFVGSPRRRAALAALTAVAVLADVACLWFALLAAGAHVGFDVAMLAITVAALSVLIPLVPGGLGIVEAAIPALTQHFGVPFEQGLAAALAYRALGTFIPAGFGALSIVHLRVSPNFGRPATAEVAV